MTLQEIANELVAGCRENRAQENLDNFTKETGVKINVAVFGSNEEMLAKLQAGALEGSNVSPVETMVAMIRSSRLVWRGNCMQHLQC